MVNELDVFVVVINLVNILVNINGYLIVYNIDYIVIVKLLESYQVFIDKVFVLCGSGGMVKVVVFVLKNVGFKQGFIIVMNEKIGKKLVEQFGYIYQFDMQGVEVDVLINVILVGMLGGKEVDSMVFIEIEVEYVEVVFDVVVLLVMILLISYVKV